MGVTANPAANPVADRSAHSADALLQAFLATDYSVAFDGVELCVRIGQPCDGLGEALGERDWAIMTACNPGGEIREAASNQVANAELARACDRSGLGRWPAVNRARQGNWPDEPGWLISPAPVDWLARQAEAFGQVGVVVGSGPGPAQLWLYGPGWPDALPADVVQGAR